MGWVDKWAAQENSPLSAEVNPELRKAEAKKKAQEINTRIQERMELQETLTSIKDPRFRDLAFNNEVNRQAQEKELKKSKDNPALEELNNLRTSLVNMYKEVNKRIGQHNGMKEGKKKERLANEIMILNGLIGQGQLLVKKNFPGAHPAGGATTTIEQQQAAKTVSPQDAKTVLESASEVEEEKAATPGEPAKVTPEEKTAENMTAAIDAVVEKTDAAAVVTPQAGESGATVTKMLTQQDKESIKEPEGKTNRFIDTPAHPHVKLMHKAELHQDDEVDENIEVTTDEKGKPHAKLKKGVQEILGVTDDDLTETDFEYQTGTDGHGNKRFAHVKRGQLAQEESITSGLDGEKVDETVATQRNEKRMKAYDMVDEDDNHYVVAAQDPYAWSKNGKVQVQGSLYLIPLDKEGKTRKDSVMMFYAQNQVIKEGRAANSLLWSDFQEVARTIGLQPISKVKPEKVGTGKALADEIQASEKVKQAAEIEARKKQAAKSAEKKQEKKETKPAPAAKAPEKKEASAPVAPVAPVEPTVSPEQKILDKNKITKDSTQDEIYEKLVKYFAKDGERELYGTFQRDENGHGYLLMNDIKVEMLQPTVSANLHPGDRVRMHATFPSETATYSSVRVQEGRDGKLYFKFPHSSRLFPAMLSVSSEEGELVGEVLAGGQPETFAKPEGAIKKELSRVNEKIAKLEAEQAAYKKSGGKNKLGINSAEEQIQAQAREIVIQLMKFYAKLLEKLDDVKGFFDRAQLTSRVKREFYRLSKDLPAEEKKQLFDDIYAEITGGVSSGNYDLREMMDQADVPELYKDIAEYIKYDESGRELALRTRISHLTSLIPLPYYTALSRLINFAKTVKPGDDLVEAYTGKDSKLDPVIKKAFQEADRLDLDALVSLQSYAQSAVIYPYVSLLFDAKKGQYYLADVNKTKVTNVDTAQMQEQFLRKAERLKGDGPGSYAALLSKWMESRKKAYQDYLNSFGGLALAYNKIAGTRHTLKDLPVLLEVIEGDIALLNKKNVTKAERKAKLPPLEARKQAILQDIAQNSGLARDASDALVALDAKFLSDLTGITAEQAIYALDAMTREEAQRGTNKNLFPSPIFTRAHTYAQRLKMGPPQYQYVNSLITFSLLKSEFRGSGMSLMKGVPEADRYMNAQEFIDYFTRADKSGANYLATKMLQGESGGEPSVNFLGEDNKRKSAIRLISHLQLALNDLQANRGQISSFYPDNSWVQRFAGKLPEMKFISGFKDTAHNKAQDSGKFSGIDMMAMQVAAFLDAKGGTYLQLIEQFGDKDLKAMIQVPRYSKEAALKALKVKLKKTGLDTKAINAEIKLLVAETSELLQPVIASNRFDLEAGMSEVLALNFALNKFELDEYFQDSKSFKNYVAQGKRASGVASPGVAPVLGLPDGFPDEHRVLILQETKLKAQIINQLTKENILDKDDVKSADGFIFHSEDFDRRHLVSFGSLYRFGGIVKATYSKVDPAKGDAKTSRFFLKGNAVVLTKAFAEEHGGAILQVYNLMQRLKLDRLAFTSTAKLFPASKVAAVTYKTVETGSGTEVASIEGLDAIGEDQVYKADSRHYLVQQDLTNHMRDFEEENMPVQLLRQMMDYKSYGKVAAAFRAIMQANKVKLDELMKLIQTGEPADIRKWKAEMRKMVGDSVTNQMLVKLLENPKVTRHHTMIRSMEDKLLSSKLGDTIFKRNANKILTIEAPSFGMKQLKGPRIVGGKVQPGQCLIPVQYDGDVVKKGKKKYIIIQRVPTTGPHSISLMEVVGTLPLEMENTIVTDRTTQQIAGSDNDGDARHVFTRFRNRKRVNPATGKREVQPLRPEEEAANTVWDAIFDEWTDPDNFTHNYTPIDVHAFDDVLKAVDERDDVVHYNKKAMRHWSLKSMMQLHQQNSEAKSGIARSANARAFIQYAHRLGMTPAVKSIDVEGKSYILDVNNATDKAMEVLGNASNYIVDNAQLGQMDELGLHTELVAAWYGMHALYAVPLEETIAFFRNPTTQRYLALLRESASPLTDLQSNAVFSKMLEEIGSSHTVSDLADQYQYLGGQEQEIADLIRVVNMGRQIESGARLIKYMEDGVSSFEDYMAVRELIKEVVQGKGDVRLNTPIFGEVTTANTGDIINLDGVKIDISKAADATRPMYEMIRTMGQYYVQSAYLSHPMRVFMRALAQANIFKPAKGQAGGKLNKKQLVAYTRFVDDYLVQKALHIHSTTEQLRKQAAEIYDSLIAPNAELSKVLLIRDGRLAISPGFGKGMPQLDDFAPFRKEFALLPEKERKILLQYHAMQYGMSINTTGGGFLSLFDDQIQEELSQRMEEAIEGLQDPANLNELLEKAIIAYPDLIAERSDLQIDITKPYQLLGKSVMVANKNGKQITNQQDYTLPLYMKAYDVEKRALVIFKKTSSNDKVYYEPIAENTFTDKGKKLLVEEKKVNKSVAAITPVSSSRIIEGDIWSEPGIPVITTNLGGVHGAGLANQAHKKGFLTYKSDGTFGDRGKVVSFPVKKVWSDKTDVELTQRSADELIKLANSNPGKTYLLPLIGLGHGEGNINDILPIIQRILGATKNVNLILPTEKVDRGKAGTVRTDNSLQIVSEIKQRLLGNVNNSGITKIISGVQTGVDVAGLDAALELGIPTGGTAAAGFTQSTEKGSIKNPQLAAKYGVKEGKATRRTGKYGEYDDVYYQRTIDNAQEADATIWFGNENSPGGKLTLGSKAQNGKPAPLVNPTTPEQIREWIRQNNIKVLNVAGNREHTNPGIYDKAKNLLLQALKPQIKYQADNLGEAAASSDPQLQEFIRTSLAKLFPGVKVFTDAAAFAEYSKQFTGEVFDPAAFGAAIGDAVYISPNTALQSTQVHEHSHIYWATLPASDPVKKALIAAFGDEESAVQALGVKGTQLAALKLRGTTLVRLVDLLKTFWSRVKKALNIMNSEDAQRIFTHDIWKGITLTQNPSNVMNYQRAKANARSKSAARTVEILDWNNKVVDFQQLRVLKMHFSGDAYRKEAEAWLKMYDTFIARDASNNPIVVREPKGDGVMLTVTMNHSYRHTESGEMLMPATNYRNVVDPDSFLYTGPKEKEEYSSDDRHTKDNIAKSIGTPIHDFIEQYFGNHLSFDEAFEAAQQDGLAPIDKELFRKFVDQFQGFLNTLEKKYDVQVRRHEQNLWHQKTKTAGKADILLVARDGSVIILDMKTSAKSAHSSSYTRQGPLGKASKDYLHKTQFVQYTMMLEENKDLDTPVEPIPVRTTYTLPIHYTLTGDTITGLEAEEPLEHPNIGDERREIEDMLMKGLEKTELLPTDASENILSQYEYARVSGLEDATFVKHMEDINNRAAVLRKKIKALPKTLRGSEYGLFSDSNNLTQEEWNMVLELGEEGKAASFRYKRFLKHYETYKTDLKRVAKIIRGFGFNEADQTIEALMGLFAELRKYDNAAYNSVLHTISMEVAKAIMKIEGREGEVSKDLKRWYDPMTMALSDATKENPELQYLARDYYSSMRKMEGEWRAWQDKHDKLARAFVAEYRKNKFGNNLLALGFDYFWGDNHEMYDQFWDKDNKLIPYSAFPPGATRDYIKFVQEQMSLKWITDQLNASRERKQPLEVTLHTSASTMEIFHRSGLYKALRNFMGDNHYVEATKIYVTMPGQTTKELKYLYEYLDALQLDTTRPKIIREALALKAIAKARKLRSESRNEDGSSITDTTGHTYLMRDGKLVAVPLLENTQRGLTRNMRLESEWHRQRPDIDNDYSRNVSRSITRFMKDMLYERYMQGFSGQTFEGEQVNMPPVLYKALALQGYYQLNRETHGRANAFMDMWMDRQQLGHKKEVLFGAAFRNTADTMIAWTYYLTMTFNLTLGAFNVMQGTLQNFIFGKGNVPKGTARYWAGWSSGKSTAILRRMGVVSIEKTESYSSTFKEHFTNLSTIIIGKGEEFIQGSLFFAQMSDEVWNNLDNEGKVIDPNGPTLSPSQIAAMEKHITDIQGKYWTYDKRNYTTLALGRIIGQFKTWLPDVLRLYTKERSTDFNGQESEGLFRSMAHQVRHFYDVSRDPNGGMGKAMGLAFKELREAAPLFSDKGDFETNQLRKEIKAMVFLGSLLVLWHSGDDDEDNWLKENAKKLFWQVNVFNPTDMPAWLTAPSYNTLKALFKLMADLFTLSTYQRDSAWGKKGEYKIFDDIVRLLPYKGAIEWGDQVLQWTGSGAGPKNEDYGKK